MKALVAMLLSALLVGGGAWVVRMGGDASNGRPDVYFLVVDTLRADHTSLYGYSRSRLDSREPDSALLSLRP